MAMKHKKNDQVTLQVKLGNDPVKTITGIVKRVDHGRAMITIDAGKTEYMFAFDAIVDE